MFTRSGNEEILEMLKYELGEGYVLDELAAALTTDMLGECLVYIAKNNGIELDEDDED